MDINFYLMNLEFPDHMTRSQDRSLNLQEVKYCILDEYLYWKDPQGILLNCVIEDEMEGEITELHKGICGRHHAWMDTTYKVLIVEYYQLKLFVDTNHMVRSCIECQLFVGKQKSKPLLLKPIKTRSHFQQWGLEFIGEINPHSSGQQRWILMETNYFTKWDEVVPT